MNHLTIRSLSDDTQRAKKKKKEKTIRAYHRREKNLLPITGSQMKLYNAMTD